MSYLPYLVEEDWLQCPELSEYRNPRFSSIQRYAHLNSNAIDLERTWHDYVLLSFARNPEEFGMDFGDFAPYVDVEWNAKRRISDVFIVNSGIYNVEVKTTAGNMDRAVRKSKKHSIKIAKDIRRMFGLVPEIITLSCHSGTNQVRVDRYDAHLDEKIPKAERKSDPTYFDV
ncbi:MAG: hypothetical protein ISS36_01270 [Candidatus Aenigmarchaeota archaeon]|nr:hypothetical protein [Candidatus Aenigmarchaeota archaeon]